MLQRLVLGMAGRGPRRRPALLEYKTNEPNICLKAGNLFMPGIGRQASLGTSHSLKALQ
jgi:hypothetical protein